MELVYTIAKPGYKKQCVGGLEKGLLGKGTEIQSALETDSRKSLTRLVNKL